MIKYLPPLPALLALALLTVTVQAQTGEHRVNFPKGNASWLIEISYHDEVASSAADGDQAATETPPPEEGQAPPPGRMKSIQVDCLDKLRRDRVTWTNGAKSETWWSLDPLFTMFQDPRINDIVAMRPDGLFDDMRLDASAFTWVNAECFVKEGTQGGRKVRHYRATLDSKGPTQAWIDAETGVPLALDDGNALYRYTILPPPAEPLVMPPQYAELLQRFVAIRAPSPVSPNKRRR